MSLTNKAKNYIRKHHTKKSVKEMAQTLNADENKVRSFVHSIKPKLSFRKKLLFYFITFSIPIVFFLAAELILRSVDYLGNTELFIDPQIPSDEYLIPNPNFAARYFFYTKTIPNPSIDAFLKNKPENSLRIFAMGGSTAAGYPYGFNGTFSRVVDDILSDALPEKNIEVVNVATSAISTYALYDQADEILEQKPDAILIYAGHNEFYGALGVGSNESIGAFPGFVRFYLKLQRFKTFLFLREMMTDAGTFLSSIFSDSKSRSGTLMERIIKDQAISLNSTEFDMAMHQFESNMQAIVKIFEEHEIPVFIATIASNIKDQSPFVSINEDHLPPADSVFSSAQISLEKLDFDSAKAYFNYAKDLDGLKFRAPEQINEIIQNLADSYGHVHLVPALNELEKAAEYGIIGNELMLEHLHPNQQGYFIIGKTFADNLLKNFNGGDFEYDPQFYFEKMHITQLDHAVVEHRIKTLKQGFPFQEEEIHPYQFNYRSTDVVDSLAFIIVHKNKRWDHAKKELGEYYESQRQWDLALQEYEGLIRNQPWNDMYYQMAARVYLIQNDHQNAYSKLKKAYQINPEAAFTTKMLGALELQNGNINEAIDLLEQSRRLNPDDVQMLYNLSGAYGQTRQFEKALEIANEAIQKNPDFPGIRQWHTQLIRIINTRNN